MSKRMTSILGVALAVLASGDYLVGDCSATLADDHGAPLITGQAADGTIDGWGFFCAQDTTKCGDVWKWVDGVLICKGAPKGYIYTRKSYSDFVLRLQWRWPPGKRPGNGGVLIRTTGPNQIWPKSLEAQINAHQAGDFWGLGGFRLSGPADRTKTLQHKQFGQLTNLKKTADVEKPVGQWNQYEIIAHGETVTLKINGQVVNRTKRCEVVPGKICLTAEGDEIHFRKIELFEP